MWKRLSAANRRNMLILIAALIVVMLGFGIIFPILPFYIEMLGAKGWHLGFLMSIFAAMQLIFSPMWGELSDRIGRRPVIIIGIAGSGITMLVFGLADSLLLLFVARALSGILASATMPAAMAYISDCTPEEDRGGGMGALGAAMGIGMTLGPGFGGWLAGISLATPFFTSAALSAVLLVFVVLYLPETHLQEACQPVSRKLVGPDFRLMWRSLSGLLGYLLLISGLMSFGLTCFWAIFGLWAHYRFGLGPQEVGALLTVVGVTFALVQGFLTGPATRRWGESRVIQASLLGSAIGLLLLLVPRTYPMLLLTTGIFMLANSMLRPSLTSLISKHCSEGQGVAMGLNSSYIGLGGIIGPLWAGFVLDIHLSLPYISGALIMAVGFLTTLRYLKGADYVEEPRAIAPVERLGLAEKKGRCRSY